MERKTGNYMHQEQNKFFLRFPSDGDVPRVFTVVLYDAFNANGLIGTEQNGIAILENGTEENPATFVVADRIHENARNSALATFNRLKTATWKEFSGAMRSIPHYRQNVADINDDADVPMAGNRTNLIAVGALEPAADGKDIRTPDMIKVDEDENSSYGFPRMSRDEAILYLLNHDVHGERYSDSYLSWNVKIDMALDMSGKTGSEEVDPDLDERWDSFAEEKSEYIFQSVTEDMARDYLEGLFTTPPGDDQGRYEFSFQGRSGGNMVLKSIDGQDVGFSSLSEMGSELESWPDKDLAQLVKVCMTLDHDLTKHKLHENWKHGVNFLRSQKEEEWDMVPAL